MAPIERNIFDFLLDTFSFWMVIFLKIQNNTNIIHNPAKKGIPKIHCWLVKIPNQITSIHKNA